MDQPTMMKVVRQPLHLNPNDLSMKAEIQRIELFQFNAGLTGGKGFRQAPTSKSRYTKSRSRQTNGRTYQHDSRADFIAKRSF